MIMVGHSVKTNKDRGLVISFDQPNIPESPQILDIYSLVAL